MVASLPACAAVLLRTDTGPSRAAERQNRRSAGEEQAEQGAGGEGEAEARPARAAARPRARSTAAP